MISKYLTTKESFCIFFKLRRQMRERKILQRELGYSLIPIKGSFWYLIYD